MPTRRPETRSRSRAAEAVQDKSSDGSCDWPGESQQDTDPEPGKDQGSEHIPALHGSIGGGPCSLQAPAAGQVTLHPSEASHIRQTYTEQRGGIWVPGIKAWLARQQQLRTGHIAIPIKADGNCAYWSLVQADDRQAFSRHRRSKGVARFAPYKHATMNYYEGAEFHHLRQNPDFNRLFPELQLSSNSIPVEAADIEQHFATDNRSASLAVCQLAALAFQIDIHIQRLSNLDLDPIILQGGLPDGGEPRRSVYLLLRENNLPIYDQKFVQIAVSEGHFWLEDRGETTNGGRPAPATPARLGNGGGSGLIRP